MYFFFRLGAPFHQNFNQITLQLEGAGVTEYLLQDVVAQRIKENRAKDKLVPNKNFRVVSLKRFFFTEIHIMSEKNDHDYVSDSGENFLTTTVMIKTSFPIVMKNIDPFSKWYFRY